MSEGSAAARPDGPSAADPRERILWTAYTLFSLHGIETIGVDRIVAEAGVAKTTLYRHFGSKEELAVAVLELREQLWTNAWLIAEVERRETEPAARLLAIFDVFDNWFRRPDYEGCLFTNALVEAHDRSSAVGAASVRKRANVRAFLRGLAEAAGVRDPDDFAWQWQMLMTGAIIAAGEGDADAALRMRVVGSEMLERERAGV